MPTRSSRSRGTNPAATRAFTAGGGAGAAASVRALLPAAVLAYAFLGEPGAALTAAAAWALSLAGEAWSRGAARQAPVADSSGAPTSGPATGSGRPAAGLGRQVPGVSSFRPFLPAGIAFVSFHSLFLASDLLRGGLPIRSAFLDSIQSALTCTVLLLPLGLPAAAAFLRSRTGRDGFSRVEAFQFTCCAGMSLAVAGSVLAGWLPPLSTAQLLWANAVGTVLPTLSLAFVRGDAGPTALTEGERPSRIIPDILVPGLLLALLLLAVYRLGLGYVGVAPRVADRARSLVFLALCLVQAGEPPGRLRSPPESGNPRARARRLAVRLGVFLAALVPAASGFLVPAARAFLGLSVPEPAAAASALRAAGIYAVLRFAARRIRSPIPRKN